MDALTGSHTRRCRRNIPFLLACTVFAGCAARTPVQTIAGDWRGSMKTGNLTVPCRWELHEDGTQTVTATLPQGLLTAQGTFMFHDDTLTQRTTTRMIVLNGEKKVMPLVNPMEATYQCQLTEDTLTLTKPDTLEKIMLTREK